MALIGGKMVNIYTLGITSVTITISVVNSSTESSKFFSLFSSWFALVFSRRKSPSPFCQQDAAVPKVVVLKTPDENIRLSPGMGWLPCFH